MTLDFSPQPLFATPGPHEGNFAASTWEKGGESFGRGWHCSWGMEESFGYRRDSVGVDTGTSREQVCDDIIKLLPADPFGMGIDSTLTAAIAGWIEDLKMDYCDDYAMEVTEDDHFAVCCDGSAQSEVVFAIEPQFFCGTSSYWMEEELPCPAETSPHLGELMSVSDGKDGTLSSDLDGESWIVDLQYEVRDGHGEICMLESDQLLLTSVGMEETLDADFEVGKEEELELGEGSSSGGHGDLPHEGFLFAIGYLGVADLLSVGSVCKTLRSAVVNDPLLWRCFHVGPPLNDRLTDDALLQLTQRAQGGLQCLNLVECSKITDDGLKRVLERNRRITKLSVLGCGRLTIEGLLNSLKLFKTLGTPRMENLMIGGIYGAEQSHYADLKQLLDLDNRQKLVRKPRFYHSGFPFPSCDYDCALDIELCPRCSNPRLVYDCPAETCLDKSSEPCRACTFCIARCDNCGRCINDDEYEETFYLDIICSDCMKYLIQSQEAHVYGPLPEKLVPLSYASG